MKKRHNMNATSHDSFNNSGDPFSQNMAVYAPFMFMNAALSIPLNAYVVGLVLTGSARTLTSDFFSLNLATCEIFMCLCSLCFFGFVRLESVVCFNIVLFSRGIVFTARPLFQCYICAECYVGVVYPVRFLRYKPIRYRVACACVAWLISLISCIYARYTFQNDLCLYAYFVQHVLLLSATASCCLRVLGKLKHPSPGDGNEKKKRNAAKRKAFKKMLIMTIFKATDSFLYVAAIPLQHCFSPVRFQYVLTIFTCLLLMIGLIQPLLYLHRAGKLVCLRKSSLSLNPV